MDESIIGLEEKLINDIVEETRKKLESGVCHELVLIWREVWDEAERNERKSILATECGIEMLKSVEDALVHERKIKDEYSAKIENLLDELQEFQENLEIPIECQDVRSLPLHNMAFLLNRKVEKYRALNSERKLKMGDLIEKESEICKQLGVVPTKSEISEMPSILELKELENNIATLEHERDYRCQIYRANCSKIASYFKELDVKPNKFELDIISCSSLNDINLTNENMKQLEEMLRRLKCQVHDSKHLAEELREKLKSAWNYLDRCEEGKAFLKSHSGHSIKEINEMKEELIKCEQEKKENLSKIIQKMRRILEEEWDQCLVSKEERAKFRPYFLNYFDEALCELHELEIQKMRNYYQANVQIFRLYSKYERLFNRLVVLEKASKSTHRFYNRGGQLLEEERERKYILKELPIVEEELRILLKKYQEEHRRPFMKFDKPMLQLLDEQWSAHFDPSSIGKLIRKKKSDRKLGRATGKKNSNAPEGSRRNLRTVNEKASANGPSKAASIVARVKHDIAKRNGLEQNKLRDSTFTVDPSYEDFKNRLFMKVAESSKSKDEVVKSGKNKGSVLKEKNEQSESGVLISLTPEAAPSTPMYSPSSKKTSKTLPRTSERRKIFIPANLMPLLVKS